MARPAFNPTRVARATPALACVLALLACTQVAWPRVGVRRALTVPPSEAVPYSVTLEQCVVSSVQAERSATFTAQMTATSATQRMTMRIELQQRLHGETAFHTVIAPGLGVWRGSEMGVKIYKYVKQVTNLAAPAAYRAVVRFRWLGEEGKLLKRAELRTPRCLEPAPPARVKQPPAPTPVA